MRNWTPLSIFDVFDMNTYRDVQIVGVCMLVVFVPLGLLLMLMGLYTIGYQLALWGLL